ncbi:MAG: ABC transporter substrate-binding protein [Eubacteriales bacterium]|nr:ABC transporter substrate-binding protein [Eubacteriales bacterium]
MKKIVAILLVSLMMLSAVACAAPAPAPAAEPAPAPAAEPAPAPAAEPVAAEPEAPAGSVYYLNFKPEQDEQWQGLAKLYTEQTGVPVTVVTAASGTYETTLKSEIAKTEAPTLFQVNGPVGYSNWKEYCYDMKDSEVYSHLSSDDFALLDNGAVVGIAYVVETYGIIYNKALLDTYFAADWSTVKSIDALNNFAALKAVAEEIQAHKKDMGVEGAFTSAGMDGSSDWRFKTHLANLPIYYEYEADGIGDTEAIKGTYLDNYKNIWDLYINNATCKPSVLSSKTGDDAVAEFATGSAVFYQNGTWAYGDIADLGDENIGMLPIYIGVEGEENQGLCTGTENFWCVNKNAAPEDIQATLDFMNWCVTSDEGRQCMAFDMGFVVPMDTFGADYLADNPLLRAANEYMAAGKKSVKWCFPTMPSEEWKNGVGSALTAYAAGTADWSGVVTAFVDGWAAEKAASKAA